MDRIAEYIRGYDFASFKKDNKTVDAVIRNFEIIGEASKKITDEIKEKNPDIPWDEMYFGIDYEIIWDIANNYLPGNKLFIDKMIKSYREEDV
jgi:uncharacterized protein with HEPN domain